MLLILTFISGAYSHCGLLLKLSVSSRFTRSHVLLILQLDNQIVELAICLDALRMLVLFLVRSISLPLAYLLAQRVEEFGRHYHFLRIIQLSVSPWISTSGTSRLLSYWNALSLNLFDDRFDKFLWQTQIFIHLTKTPC